MAQKLENRIKQIRKSAAFDKSQQQLAKTEQSNGKLLNAKESGSADTMKY